MELPCDFGDIESIKEFISSETNLNNVIEQITGINSTTPTKWGSCSYSTIYSMYSLLSFLFNHYETTDEIYKLMKFDVKKIKSRKLETNHVKAIIENYKQHISESIESDLDDANITTIQGCLQFMKDNDEDLWDSIKYIFDSMFPNCEINNIPEAFDRSGQESQKENNIIGFKCFHLVANNYIQQDEIFCDFPI